MDCLSIDSEVIRSKAQLAVPDVGFNEGAARFMFLIGRGQVVFLVDPKIRHKFCWKKSGWHNVGECAPESWRRQELEKDEGVKPRYGVEG
jgi:hypothetical protein